MSDNENQEQEPLPYKLTLMGDITPTDVAWAHVSMLPKERYLEMLKTERGFTPEQLAEVFPDLTNDISMQLVGWDKAIARALIDTYSEKLTAHQSVIDKVEYYGQRHGLDISEIEHMQNIFALGILVGERSADTVRLYAETGIKDIEAGPES